MRLLKNKVLTMTIFVAFFIFSSFLIRGVKSIPPPPTSYDARFTGIYVTNGNSEIDLIDGAWTAKVCDEQQAEVKLTFRNYRCGVFGADFFTRVFRDGEHVGTSSETFVGIGSSDTDVFSYVMHGPATHSFMVELWWENGSEHSLEDMKWFELKVVKLTVSSWTSLAVSVERGFEAKDLTVTFANGGNDWMYDVSVSVTDSAGLTVTPQTQNLGAIYEGETKTTTFSVEASKDLTPKEYRIIFEVAYHDLRGVKDAGAFIAHVTVHSNFIRENLNYILIAVIIVAISLVAIVSYLKIRKPKQAEISEP